VVLKYEPDSPSKYYRIGRGISAREVLFFPEPRISIIGALKQR
jgi:hypothetical protein